MSWVDFGAGHGEKKGPVKPPPFKSRREVLSAAVNRKATEIQDRQVLALLRKGHSRKAVCSQLTLTYGQVSGAVYRHEAKKKIKSNL